MAVLNADDRYTRLNVTQERVLLKIELINDVPAHVGAIEAHATLGRLDSAENILANKVTALIGRSEPKDLADVWGFCSQMNLSLPDAIENAHSKAAGIFPPDLARVLCSVREADWQVIRWVNAPPPDAFMQTLNALGQSLIL